VNQLFPDAIAITEYSINANKAYIEILNASFNLPFVRLEDDIVLTSDFKAKIEDFISQYPNELISFFTLKKSVKKTQFMPGKTFCMFQCTYFPAGMAQNIINYYNRVWCIEKELFDPTGMDILVADYLYLVDKDYILYQPSLVQHIKGKSAIGKRSSARQSSTFKP